MVKGCQRKIYYLKNTGSKYFEEAYLVLKREENGKAQASQTELSREAERRRLLSHTQRLVTAFR